MSHLKITVKGYLVHDTLHESGFTLTVSSYERHLLAALYAQRHITENSMLAISLAHVIADNREITTAQAWRKLEVHGRVVHLVHLDRHNLLQLLYSALHLNSLCGLITESLDEVAQVGNLLLLILVCPHLLLSPLLAQLHIFIVFHAIVNHLAA